MCGITGIVVPPGGEVPTRVLEQMTGALRRRGPDDQGIFLDPAGGCGLGHRRLSIIDLAGGHQPLSNGDQTIQVVVNGEIYNFRSLRGLLEAAGARFRTGSDSEVLAHGYERWGLGVFQRISGMYAVAIWDARAERLVLARDPMGKKPLYYAFVDGETLIFGSEPKALLHHPSLGREVSLSGLALYLTYECVPESSTIYRAVVRLRPGELLTFDRRQGRAHTHTFWHMRFGAAASSQRELGEPVLDGGKGAPSFGGAHVDGDPDAPSFCGNGQDVCGGGGARAGGPRSRAAVGHSLSQCGAALWELIRVATADRLVADVPLGVFLSGGIDSSTVAAAMATLMPTRDIKTFSMTFDDPSFDEGQYARQVAAHLGTHHHEARLDPGAMLEAIPVVADFMCEPLGDASIIPTYLLSRFTRETVTVALGGDGGDELFFGYPTFQADRVASAIEGAAPKRIVRGLGRALAAVGRALPVSRRNFSLDFKVKRFAQGLGYPAGERHQAWLGSFLPEQLTGILADDVREGALATSPYAQVGRVRDRGAARDDDDRLVLQYSRLYLAADVLVKVDRASMACGLEVRAPLLDTRIVDYVNSVSARVRFSGLTAKPLLKAAVRSRLPKGIVDRPKKGFGVPVGPWLRGPLRPMVRDLLAGPKLRREGFFDPAAVQRLLDEHDRGVADHRKPLWTLLAFELWLERFGPSGVYAR